MNGSFKQFGVKLAYEQLEKRGDKLEPLTRNIDWSRFQTLFFRRGGKGRPSYNPVLMFKVLILQNLYGISDEEIEYQITDRISFQKFLEFPQEIPDHTTIWRFREYLSENGLDDAIWNELNRQIQEKGIHYSNLTSPFEYFL